jgi:hypothetical protein
VTSHLLLVTIGPVQEFIAQARRTRDLWFGSHVLSEISRAAARELATGQGANLIFPALSHQLDELRRCRRLRRAGGERPLSIPRPRLMRRAPRPRKSGSASPRRCVRGRASRRACWHPARRPCGTSRSEHSSRRLPRGR